MWEIFFRQNNEITNRPFYRQILVEKTNDSKRIIQ